LDLRTSVYLRADGNSQIGLGHVHRLLALSEILNELFKCTFIIRSPLQGIRDLILQNCSDIIALGDEVEHVELEKIAAHLQGNEIVVLDGYHFGTSYQRIIKKKGSALVCIDDIQHQHYVADVILNTSGGVRENLYSREPYTKIYTGPDVVLLKKPFRLASKIRTARSNASIFICMGGADPDDHTLSVLRHCLPLHYESYHVVIGEAYLHRERLMNFATGSKKSIEVLVNVGPETLAETMKACATAVCSASGIAYEYLSVGGALYIKQTASNQDLLYSYFIEAGLAFRWEDIPVTEDKISSSLLKQSQIFDGNADKRVLRIFNTLDFELNTEIRKGSQSDLMTVFQWANDPESRRQSYNQEPIALDVHAEWFTKKINDSTSVLYIFEYKKVPMGQVRFDLRSETLISYSIDKMFRGRGWGLLALKMAITNFEKEYQLKTKIVGYVKQDNTGSNMIFKNLGFVQVETKDYPNSYKYEYLP
jgi:UDP-2,4-diacetamido-2,4,6-trideoxy-beta-L-altropyranose hydrolase